MNDHLNALLRSRAVVATAAGVHPMRLARAALGLSQEDLAHSSGLERSAISRIESRERIPDEATRTRIAGALDVDVDSVFPARVLVAASRPDLPKVDTTAIIDDELRPLGDPLPVEIARLGAGGLANKVRRVLQERDLLSGYTEADYRDAVREAISRLTDPNRANASAGRVEGNILHAHALAILAEQGKLESHTPEEYLAAVRAAERKTGLDYSERSEERLSAPGIGSVDGAALHVQAELILGERGAKTNPRGQLVYTAAEYADALLEARDRLHMLPSSD
jgi:transcriptional regulator with XRE-family HTH domain